MAIAQNRDARIPIIPYNEPVFLTARFAGNGTSQLNAVAGTTKSGLTFNRTGVGALTLSIPTPVGTIQMLDVWVNTPSGTAAKIVQVTPPTAGATTVAMQIAFQANSVAADIASTEELNIDLRLAATAYP